MQSNWEFATDSLPPLDHSPINGFRLVKYASDERLAELSKPLDVFRRDFRNAKPVSDEVFQVFKRQFAYAPSPPNAKVELTDGSSPDWTREKVTLDAGYGERLTTYLVIPKNGASRHQAVVLFPGLGQFLTNTSTDRISGNDFGLDFVVKSGRILVAPVWSSSTPDTARCHGARAFTKRWRGSIGILVRYGSAWPRAYRTQTRGHHPPRSQTRERHDPTMYTLPLDPIQSRRIGVCAEVRDG